MGFRINTNVPSLSAQRTLGVNNRKQEESMAKLSSGSRITKSADDAAGLAISEKLNAQIRSTKQAERNANDGISMIQTAEGGLNEVQNILVRLRELSIQAASDTVGEDERAFSNLEYQNLISEVQRIADVTEFNGMKLLNGEGDDYEFQIGINNNPYEDRISYKSSVVNAQAGNLGIEGLDITEKSGAQGSLETLDAAITSVSGQRAELGALQSRLTSTISNLQVSNESLSAANSRIRDTDYASETAQLTKQNILTSSGTSVLAQANSNGSRALQLLG